MLLWQVGNLPLLSIATEKKCVPIPCFQLNKIVSLSIREKANHKLVLNVQLPENTCFEFLFQVSAKEEINQLLDQFRELTTR